MFVMNVYMTSWQLLTRDMITLKWAVEHIQRCSGAYSSKIVISRTQREKKNWKNFGFVCREMAKRDGLKMRNLKPPTNGLVQLYINGIRSWNQMNAKTQQRFRITRNRREIHFANTLNLISIVRRWRYECYQTSFALPLSIRTCDFRLLKMPALYFANER